MRSSLLSAACVAALFALPALAQETTTTTDDTATTDTATTDTATTDTATTETTDTETTDTGTADAGATATEGATGDDAAGQATDAGTVTTTETTEGGAATTEGAATEGAATEAAEAGTATEATEGEVVVTETGSDAATEQAPLPSDPQQALALAAAQLDEAADNFSANYGAGLDPAATGATGTEGTATTTTVEVDPESRQQLTDALDSFDQALTQYGSEGGDQQVQDQIATLQSQTTQIREQLESDPATALEGIEQITQAAMTLPQAEIPAEADSIMGRQLVSSDGEEVGEINNVLVTADGQVEAVVITRGGALGLGGTDVAVPWDQLQIQGDQMMVNMTRDQMEQMPEYVTD